MGKGKKGGNVGNDKREERMQRAALQKERRRVIYGDANWRQDWRKFEIQMQRIGFDPLILGKRIVDVAGDGNCLFRALSDQIDGSPNNHAAFRQAIIGFLQQNRQDFEPFIEDDEPWNDYIRRMSKSGQWGGNIEIQAASLNWAVNITIHQLDQV